MGRFRVSSFGTVPPSAIGRNSAHDKGRYEFKRLDCTPHVCISHRLLASLAHSRTPLEPVCKTSRRRAKGRGAARAHHARPSWAELCSGCQKSLAQRRDHLLEQEGEGEPKQLYAQ